MVVWLWLFMDPQGLIKSWQNMADPTSQIEKMIQVKGSPIVMEGGALFLAQAQDGTPPTLLGDFNQWGWTPDRNVLNAQKMTRIARSKWYAHWESLHPDARIEYVLFLGEDRSLDPHNPNVVPGWRSDYSEIRMPQYRPCPEVGLKARNAGRIETFQLASQVLNNERNVHVYTPFAYDPKKTYPLAIFGDGTAYVERGKVPQLLDYLIEQKQLPGLIAVFVDPVDRSAEYRANPKYATLIKEELLPRIRQGWSVSTDATKNAIIGGSRGAMAASHLALNTDLFGFSGCFAPAFHPLNPEEVFANYKKGLRFWVFVGEYDIRWKDDGFQFVDLLREEGYFVESLIVSEGHNLTAWQHKMKSMLLCWQTN